MKSILLATTALVAFAGAAAADGHTSITHTMSATLGYNDTVADAEDNEIGFYWEGNLKTTASAELDNGLTAGAYFEVTVAEDNDDSGETETDYNMELSSSDFVLSLEAENGGLFFGDTGRAAEKYWKSAGDMEADGVSTGSDSMVLRGDVTVGPVKASVSYLINDAYDDDGADPNEALEQLSFGAEADLGVVTLTAAYQEETDYADGDGDFNPDEIYGVSAVGTFGGATVTVAYASNETDDEQSTGIKVAYPFGPVTATAYYVNEADTVTADELAADPAAVANEDPNYGINIAYADGPISVTADYQDDQGTEKWSVNGSYDVGNGLSIFGGFENQNEGDDVDYHVGGKYDLGGGADLTVTYAVDEDGDQEDEIGSDDYQEGTTVELNFSF